MRWSVLALVLLLAGASTAAAKGIAFSLEVERPSEAAGELVRVT